MTVEWPIEIDGFAYRAIPESWLEHPHAVDRDGDGPRLFAVSAAAYGGRTLKVRYAEPRTGEVLQMIMPAREYGGGLVPEGLLDGAGWTRSRTPPPAVEPVDVLRQPELEHLQELWTGQGPANLDQVALHVGGVSI